MRRGRTCRPLGMIETQSTLASEDGREKFIGSHNCEVQRPTDFRFSLNSIRPLYIPPSLFLSQHLSQRFPSGYPDSSCNRTEPIATTPHSAGNCVSSPPVGTLKRIRERRGMSSSDWSDPVTCQQVRRVEPMPAKNGEAV